MPKENIEPYRISGQQLVDAKREIIPCSLSLDIGLGGGVPRGSTVLIGGRQKSGKAQPLTAKVLTPSGFKNMGEMKVGDKIIGQDGKQYNITGIFPQGIKDVYKVSMEDGGSTECCGDHLWEVSNVRRNKFTIQSTKDILSNLDNQQYYIKKASFTTFFSIPMYRKCNKYRRIVSINLVGKKECQCISTDAPGGLYITDDFIVTHNTTLSLQIAANAQNLYGAKVLFYPPEGRLTKLVLGQIQGIKLDQQNFEVILPPAIKDKKTDEIRGHVKWTGEQWWDAIGQGIVDNPGSVIIVDAISNLSSEKEISESVGYQDRGGRNKLESSFCRKYGDLVVANKVVLILLAHIQANTSGYGPPLQLKVGNDIRHQADIILFCKTTEKWPEKDGRILGHDIVFQVEASALGPPHIEVKLPLKYGTGIDTIQDIITHCITWGIIKQAGAWYEMPFEESEEVQQGEKPLKFQGEDKIRNWLSIHPKHLEFLNKTVREKVLL